MLATVKAEQAVTRVLISVKLTQARKTICCPVSTGKLQTIQTGESQQSS